MGVIGKSTGVIGSIISIIFSIVGIASFSVLNAMFKTDEFIESYTNSYVEAGGHPGDIEATLDIFDNLLSFGKIVAIIFILIGIVGFILVLLTNNENKRKMSPFILLIGIIHIFSLRILAAILLIVSSRQLSKNYQPATPTEA